MKPIVLLCAAALIAATPAPASQNEALARVVDDAVKPVIAKNGIPGMAVAVTVRAKSYVFTYGVASTSTHQPVTRDTLFELGSVSKTFTATLASLAQVDGRLSLSDTTAKYIRALHGTPFGNVRLLDLGTHTPGGLPVQVPEKVTNDEQLLQYFKDWRPAYAPGMYRTYGNPGIGMLGVIAAKSMGQNFTALMERRVFASLGLTNTFIDVPQAKAAQYAQGYTEDGAPIRLSPGMLWAQAYGVRSSAADMIRFVEANMHEVALDAGMQRAITQTHTGYFQAGAMTQDLIWEQYPYPATLAALQTGNSPAVIYKPTPVRALSPPQQPRENVWVNKTGSTNGFAAYVAFVPKERIGVVILANKSYPIRERVKAAFDIITAIATAGTPSSSGSQAVHTRRR